LDDHTVCFSSLQGLMAVSALPSRAASRWGWLCRRRPTLPKPGSGWPRPPSMRPGWGGLGSPSRQVPGREVELRLPRRRAGALPASGGAGVARRAWIDPTQLQGPDELARARRSPDRTGIASILSGESGPRLPGPHGHAQPVPGVGGGSPPDRPPRRRPWSPCRGPVAGDDPADGSGRDPGGLPNGVQVRSPPAGV